MLKKVLAFVGFAALSLAQDPAPYPAADLVKELYQQPNIAFGLYSGYVQVPNTKKDMHYVAALSQGDATKDPVIIWFGGGPGCSALIGYAMEHGPYTIEDGNNEFTPNEQAWNKNATVIYLDGPANTGYSICEEMGECDFTDELASEDLTQAILTLLREKFIGLKSNPLWIAGEDYAGIYAPHVATKLDKWIVETKALTPDAWVPNLKGMVIGNGYTDWRYDGKPAFVTMAYYHGLIDDELYDYLKDNCNVSYVNVRGVEKLSADCQSAMQTFQSYVKYANPFDVFGKCYKAPTPVPPTPEPTLHASHNQFTQVSDDGAPKKRVKQQRVGTFEIECMWTTPMIDYFNNETVMTQLNIPPEYQYENWIPCTKQGENGFNYTMNETGSAALYNDLLNKGYKVLFYSGTAGSIVPTLGSQQWITQMGWPVTLDWRPYFVQVSPTTRQVGGYVEIRNNFTFATVHGAGHYPPRQRRVQTNYVVFNFINNLPIQ